MRFSRTRLPIGKNCAVVPLRSRPRSAHGPRESLHSASRGPYYLISSTTTLSDSSTEADVQCSPSACLVGPCLSHLQHAVDDGLRRGLKKILLLGGVVVYLIEGKGLGHLSCCLWVLERYFACLGVHLHNGLSLHQDQRRVNILEGKWAARAAPSRHQPVKPSNQPSAATDSPSCERYMLASRARFHASQF